MPQVELVNPNGPHYTNKSGKIVHVKTKNKNWALDPGVSLFTNASDRVMLVTDRQGVQKMLSPGEAMRSRSGFDPNPMSVPKQYLTSSGKDNRGISSQFKNFTAALLRRTADGGPSNGSNGPMGPAGPNAGAGVKDNSLLYQYGKSPQASAFGIAKPGSDLAGIAEPLEMARRLRATTDFAGAPANTSMPEGMLPDLPTLQSAGVPMPNISDYVGPYENAMAKVREYAAAATPEIQAAYDNLASRLAKYAAEGAAANTAMQASTAARLQEGSNTVAGAYQANIDQLNQYGGSGLGSISAGAQAEQAAAQAQFARQQAAQQDLLSNIGMQQQQAAQDRSSAADAARSQALTSKEVAMQAALSQLEGGKAQASRQYASDAAQAGAASASSANAATQANFDMAMKLAQSKNEYASQQSDAYNKSLVSGKDWLMNEYAFDAQQQMPQTWGAFEALLQQALKPDKNNVPADQLTAEASDARRLDYALGSIDNIVETYKQSGYQVDPAALRRWLKIYFTPGNTMLSSEKARANGYIG